MHFDLANLQGRQADAALVLNATLRAFCMSLDVTLVEKGIDGMFILRLESDVSDDFADSYAEHGHGIHVRFLTRLTHGRKLFGPFLLRINAIQYENQSFGIRNQLDA